MKKILEVLQYGDYDIRFKTDIDVVKNPKAVIDINSQVLFSMLTKLWGGNETSVLAMIRVLAIADLAASVDIDEMVKQLAQTAHSLKESMDEARREFERNGGKVLCFGPEFKPGPVKS